jgi:hypothetical protein
LTSAGDRLRWSLEQRLSFVEFRLFFEGAINRSDLMDRFGVSAPQASADLARYQSIAPQNLEDNSSLKKFVAGQLFQPALRPLDAQTYLEQVVACERETACRDHWLRSPPPTALVPQLERVVPAQVLRAVLDAIHSRRALFVDYQSFSNAEPARRWIAPHAIAFDGFRWHARAWCESNREFRDFVIARILDVVDLAMSAVDGSCDAEWTRRVTLRLAPNPHLPQEMRSAIEYDYGMTRGEKSVETRVCAVYYFERLYGLDLDPELLPPKRLQVVLVNRPEVDRVCKDARRATKEAVRHLRPRDSIQAQPPRRLPT